MLRAWWNLPGMKPWGPSRRLSLPELRPKLLRIRPRRRVTRGWLKLRPSLKLKSLEYTGYTTPKFGTRPSNELGWKLRPTFGRRRAYFILQPSVRLPPLAPRLWAFHKRLRLLSQKLLRSSSLLASRLREESLMMRHKHLEVWIPRCLKRLPSLRSALKSLVPRSQPSFFNPYRPFPLLISPKAPRLILLNLPKKGMSPRAPRLVLLGLPRMWPKRNRRSRSLGQLLYLLLV